jgi:hypothetical protein
LPDRRTYDDDEVREIFSLAAETRDQDTASARTEDRSGLTLPELKEIGREVGLKPDRIAEAAALFDARLEALPRRTFLGGPTGVHRTVELPRELTDREWEALAGELRETFDARGRVISRGSAREWTDGEVHAFLEPSGSGHRLRLYARTFPLTVAAGAGAFGVFAGLLALLTSALDEVTFGPVMEVVLPLMLVLIGAGAIGMNVLRLRRWADDRERRMEHVSQRARALAEEAPPEEPA